MTVPGTGVHHGPMVSVEITPEQMADLYIPDKDIYMLDAPSWIVPTITAGTVPLGHGPMVPYHGPDVDLTYGTDIRDDDPNPRPHKQVYGEEGRRWGIGPNLVAWHGHTPTQMDYILGRLD